MKKLTLKANPILKPYLPRFRDVLWIFNGFSEVILSDMSLSIKIQYKVQVEYFTSITEQIMNKFPSRKQVDALMEMLYFVMVWHFFMRKDHYDHFFQTMVVQNANLTADEKAAFLKRYERFIARNSKWCDEYIQKCKIDVSMLPSDVNDYNIPYSSNSFSSFVRNELNHYIDLTVLHQDPSIIDFSWSNLSQYDLVTKLRERERAFNDKVRKKGSHLPKGQTWIEFDDGYKWVYIPKHQCREIGIEGEHSATVESWMGTNFGRLLYLADDQHNLVVTASYCWLNDHNPDRKADLHEGRDWGILGQIRGTANTKPKQKYQKYIARLFCDERVIGHIPDGYRSRDQFLLSDLDELQLGIIEQANPVIFDFPKVVELIPLAPIMVLIHLFAQEKVQLADVYDDDQPQPDALFSYWKGDGEDFFKALDQEQASQLFKMIKDGDDLIYYSDSYYDVENFVEGLDKQELKVLAKKLKELGHGSVKPDAKKILEIVKENKEIQNAISRSVFRGYESGSEAEAFKQLVERANHLIEILNNEKGLNGEIKNESLYGDEAIVFTISLKELIKDFKGMGTSEFNVSMTLGLEDVAQELESDLHEHRNQFEDYFSYDQEAAKEDFFGYQIYEL